jgi:hypothetical protein
MEAGVDGPGKPERTQPDRTVRRGAIDSRRSCHGLVVAKLTNRSATFGRP